MAVMYRLLLFIMCRSYDFRIKRVEYGYDVRHVSIPDIRLRLTFTRTGAPGSNLGIMDINGRFCLTEQDIAGILKGELLAEWLDFSTPGIGGLDHMTSRDFDSACRLLGIEEHSPVAH